MIFQLIFCFFVVMLPSHVAAFDWHFEGRLESGSAYVFDPPKGFSNFDTDVELRAGVLGNAWHKDEWNLDYEISGNFKHVGGPRVQAGFEDDFDADFFRAWLRLEKGNFKIRGGRQDFSIRGTYPGSSPKPEAWTAFAPPGLPAIHLLSKAGLFRANSATALLPD